MPFPMGGVGVLDVASSKVVKKSSLSKWIRWLSWFGVGLVISRSLVHSQPWHFGLYLG